MRLADPTLPCPLTNVLVIRPLTNPHEFAAIFFWSSYKRLHSLLRWVVMSDATPEPCEIVPNCPICSTKLRVAHSHSKLKICVCHECGTSLSIPDDAWTQARMMAKRQTPG